MRLTYYLIAVSLFMLGASLNAHTAVDNDIAPKLIAYPGMPEVLEPYVSNGVFDPGDFEWMRGRFAGDSDADKTRYAQIAEWLDRCAVEERERVSAELATLGGSFFSEGRWSFVTSPFCGQFAIQPAADAFESFTEFEEVMASVKPIYRTLHKVIGDAQTSGGFRGSELADQLNRRPMKEQVLRRASMWGRQEPQSFDGPILDAKQAAIWSPLVWGDVATEDRKNTTWLKAVIAKEGWPTVSKVGEYASSRAWLLVQHADLDPVFQLKTLRLMEPLAETGEVSKKNYAYLYDRIMLKLAGKQRYATQLTCKDGQYAPRDLEDPERMDQLRKEVGLGPFSDYRKRFPKEC